MDDKEKSVSPPAQIHILPYTLIVGQEQLKLALELAYIAPGLGGVLIAGQRGTAKSTAVRAFAKMTYGRLPVTLPINATEDRVVGGYRIDALMRSQDIRQPGLLEEANDSLLYIDEVNLLDDHIVNLILDVSSTRVLVVQREGINEQKSVTFTLVGTMNPEEGGLRPQLLDRFGLMVGVMAEKDLYRRSQILRMVMDFDESLFQLRSGQSAPFIEKGNEQDRARHQLLLAARERVDKVAFPEEIAQTCVSLATEFNVEGHRGDYMTAMAARAMAALDGSEQVQHRHLRQVAPLALQHRRREFQQSQQWLWSTEDVERLDGLLKND